MHYFSREAIHTHPDEVGLKPPDQLLASYEDQLGPLIRERNRNDALRLLRRCVTLSRLTYGDCHWKTCFAWSNLAKCYLELCNLPKQALEHCEYAKKLLGSREARHINGSKVDIRGMKTGLVDIKLIHAQVLIKLAEECTNEHEKRDSITTATKLMKEADSLTSELATVSVSDDVIDSKNLGVAKVFARLAEVEGNYDGACVWYTTCIDLVQKSETPDDDPEQIPLLRAIANAKIKSNDCGRMIEAIDEDLTKAFNLVSTFRSDLKHLIIAGASASFTHPEQAGDELLGDIVFHQARAFVALSNTLVVVDFGLAPKSAEEKENEDKKVYWLSEADHKLDESQRFYSGSVGRSSVKYLAAADEQIRVWVALSRDPQEIEARLAKCEPLKRRCYGDMSESVANCLQARGSMLLQVGDLEGAAKLLQKCHHMKKLMYNNPSDKRLKQIDALLSQLKINPSVKNVINSEPSRPRFK